MKLYKVIFRLTDDPSVQETELIAGENAELMESWGYKLAAERTKRMKESWDLFSVSVVENVSAATYEGTLCKIRVESPKKPSGK